MEPPPERATLSPRVFYVALLALALRLVYLTDHARSPLFQFPVLDALYYDTVARLLAAGESLTAINPGFRPLLYPWLLSRLYRLSPEAAIPLALVGQHLLGVASTVLTLWIAFRLSRSNAVAATAGALFALAGPPLYFEGELLLTALTTFLGLALVAFLVRFLPVADGGPGVSAGWRWLLAGGLLGLAAQARPNVLLFAAALPLGAVVLARLEERAGAWRRALAPAALALTGLLLTLALFGLLQRPAFGRFQMTTGAGGINFYLGNKRQADGMIPRQDRSVTYADSYRDSVQLFAREELARARGVAVGEPTSSEISRYWLGRGLREIAAAPGAWAGLMARKSWFLVGNREIPNNRGYEWVATSESRVLGFLPVRWWLLVCLAPLGVAALWRRSASRGALFWVVSFILCWSAGLVLFFVNSRFRAPLWPLMCVLAAAGGARLIQAARAAVRHREWGALLSSAAPSAAIAVLSLVNWLGIPAPGDGRDFFYRSVANLELGRVEAARRDAEASVAAESDEAPHHFQLASVLLAQDRPREAIGSLREAVRLEPGEPRIWNNLGVALERVGRTAEAYASYRTAISLVADYAPALANAALLELRAGRPDAAAAHLGATSGLRHPSVHLLCARAFLARARGRAGEAEDLLEEARAIDPEIVRRLEEESRLPVSLDPA